MFGYPDDVRTLADILCDEAPPVPAAVREMLLIEREDPNRQHLVNLSGPTGFVLEGLLALGEFTPGEAAKAIGCRQTSVRNTLRAHAERFERVRERAGKEPALWRVRPM
jgi:hypothetical protein